MGEKTDDIVLRNEVDVAFGDRGVEITLPQLVEERSVRGIQPIIADLTFDRSNGIGQNVLVIP